MNTVLKITVHILFVMTFGLSFAQNRTIKGKVLDVENIQIENAAIVLYDTNKKIISYTISNQDGYYEIETENLKIDYTLKITHIIFFPKEYVFKQKDIEIQAVNLNFILDENKNTLDEVIIVSSNKVKDTVRLDLKKLKLYEDDNLKEILSKIPNFRLSDDGTIIYKGKNINKVLVNNKPSFVNQNSIALESIENKIIEGISIINNYNDDFTIDFDEDEESVLNIDTKKQTQSVFNGSIESKYGYNNKYEFKGKGLYFSKNLNAFLTNHTNNIGKSIMTSNEIKQLFSKEQPISNYQEKSLRILFSRNENLKKDFFNSTSITLRNQTQRFKTSGVLYYIAPNRINSIVQNIETLSNTSLLNTQNQSTHKSHTVLGAFLIASKLSDRTILTYNLNANYIDDKNKSKIDNQLFETGIPTGTNNTLSNNTNITVASYHQLVLRSKLKNSLISETKIKYYNEDSELLNNYEISNPNTVIFNQQEFNFTKNVLTGEASLKYKFSNIFISSFTLGYTTTKENLKDENNNLITNRGLNDLNVGFKTNGRKVFKKLNYDFFIGINSFENKILNSSSVKKKIFIPIDISLDYENRLNRYYIGYSKSSRFNNLESGINTIQAVNDSWIGTAKLPLNINTSDNFNISYNYDNLFDAELFSLSFKYSNQKNEIRKRFVEQQNGIRTFKLFNAKKSNNFRASSFYSKTVFPYEYPTKLDFELRYNAGSYPILSDSKTNDASINSISSEVKFETITDNLLNFRFSSNLSFVKDKIDNQTYNSSFISSAFSILIKNNRWRGTLSFLFDKNYINSNDYTRKNLNFSLSHTKNKATFSIEARHIGELFSFFENDTYNTQFVVSNGTINTVINNQSLNYIIIGIKYKL